MHHSNAFLSARLDEVIEKSWISFCTLCCLVKRYDGVESVLNGLHVYLKFSSNLVFSMGSLSQWKEHENSTGEEYKK